MKKTPEIGKKQEKFIYKSQITQKTMPKAEPKRKRAKPWATNNAVSIIQPSIKVSPFILCKNPRGKSPRRVTAQVVPAVPHLVIAYLYHTFLAIGNGIENKLAFYDPRAKSKILV